jgi:hypothetical protein
MRLLGGEEKAEHEVKVVLLATRARSRVANLIIVVVDAQLRIINANEA